MSGRSRAAKVLGCILALLAGWLVHACSRSDSAADPRPAASAAQSHAQERATAVGARLREDDGRRVDALVKALAAPDPRPDLGPCSIALMAPAPRATGDAGQDAGPATLSLLATERTLRIPAADVATTPGLRLTRLSERIAGEVVRPSRGIFAGPPDETIDALASPSAFAWELDVVVDERREPRMLDDKRFAGGVLRGRALLYSYLREDVVCASDFVAGSAERLRPYDGDPKSARDALFAELESEALREAARGLVKVGPRAGAAADAGRSDASTR